MPGAGLSSSGFSLIEVLIALCLVAFFTVAIAKMNLISVRLGASGACSTVATVLANEQLLAIYKSDAAGLAPGWYADPHNPLINQGMSYYRFWQISRSAQEWRAEVFVAWPEPNRGRPSEQMARAELDASAHVSLRAIGTSQ